jgi:hypothetical protein
MVTTSVVKKTITKTNIAMKSRLLTARTRSILPGIVRSPDNVMG